MNKRIIVIVVLAVLLTASAYAQTADFFELAKTGTAQDVQAAIDKGEDVNARDKDGKTALMGAVNNFDSSVIVVLLKAGADVNVRAEDGSTALMLAASTDFSPEYALMLLRAGADINARDKAGWTALMYAAGKNQHADPFVTMLLKAGADAKLKNNKGYTALDYAKIKSYLEGTDALKKLEEASK